MERFTDYHKAYNSAVRRARRIASPMCIRRTREFGRDGFNVSCWSPFEPGEVIRPSDPLFEEES